MKAGRHRRDAAAGKEGDPTKSATIRPPTRAQPVERRASRCHRATTESADGAELRKWLERNAEAHGKARSEGGEGLWPRFKHIPVSGSATRL